MTKAIIGRIIKFDTFQTDDGATIQSIDVKMSPISAVRIFFGETNLFFNKFNEGSVGKRYNMTVEEEANQKGGLKTRLVEYHEIIDDNAPEEQTPLA